MTIHQILEHALLLASQGDWRASHELIDAQEDPLAYWLHASLHREEGDLANARYWYGRAERPFSDESFADERARIAEALRAGPER